MIQAATAIELEFEPSGLILCGSLDCDPIAAAKSLNIENLSYLTESLNDYLTDAAGLFRQQKYYDYFANRHLDDLFIEIINRRYSHPEAIKLNFKALATYNVRQQLAQLSIPILVIHGTAEKVIPPDLVVDMASQHARMVVEWLPEGGHNGFYQQHQDTIEILQRYYSWLVSSSEPESRG
jgi:pimeloyl-ACP methyl ester carboxylesterase